MIERLYIDNYRTFVNCEIRLGAIALLLGPNSTGKSSVFDVVHTIRRFVGGTALTSELFSGADLTRWQKLDEQAFALDVRTPSGLYRYELRLGHSRERRESRVLTESLELDGKPLFTFRDGEIQLYNDRHDPGPQLSFDWHRSGLSTIRARNDNTKLTEFKQRLASVQFLRSCPPIMDTVSGEESEELAIDGGNFPSWFRYILRQDISSQLKLFEELRQVIDGFESLQLDGPADSTTTLRVLIKPKGSEPLSFKFGELSDGQRQLIVLHTILFGVSDKNRVLFLDEPDNYVALREVEPWLVALIDAPSRSIAQAVVISHHPEVIDHLAREKGIWFKRDSAGPTRIEMDNASKTSGLKQSELEARGW
ncbi:MAG: AAA family ATPase [Phycisphaerales bacterium]|nr:MAG: AAA family ATPase [Phycisphaerales bacterium]